MLGETGLVVEPGVHSICMCTFCKCTYSSNVHLHTAPAAGKGLLSAQPGRPLLHRITSGDVVQHHKQTVRCCLSYTAREQRAVEGERERECVCVCVHMCALLRCVFAPRRRSLTLLVCDTSRTQANLPLK
jgi:hypothetical protein